MMLPWIVVGWLRAILDTFNFFLVLVFPVESCLQFFYFLVTAFRLVRLVCHRGKLNPIFFLTNTLYSLNMVTKSYRLMLTTATENLELDNAENLTYIKLLVKCFFLS